MNATAGSGRVQKKTLDVAISGAREFWNDFNVSTHFETQSRLHGIFRELSFQVVGNSSHWTMFADLVNAAVKLDENISDETIYEIFRLTGVCVE